MGQNDMAWSDTRVKVPTVLQMEATECGAASLSMIMSYYGKRMPLEQIRIDCDISRNGSQANNLIKAARDYGFTAKGYSVETPDLHRFKLPMIIFWEFNHFVVLEGIKKDKVYLNDPASGPRTISLKQFNDSFTGVVLTFEPNENFRKEDHRKSIFASLMSRLGMVKMAITFIFLCSLFLVVPGLLIPCFSQVFVDYVMGDHPEWLRPLLLGLAMTAVLRGVLLWLQQYALMQLELKLILNSATKFLNHLLRLPIAFFSQRFPGELQNRVAINDRVARLVSGPMATNFINVFMIFFFALMMFQYDVVLTLTAIFVAMLNVVVLIYAANLRKVLNQTLLQERGKMIGISMNGIQLIETIKAMGCEVDFFTRWSGSQAKVINAHQRMTFISCLLGTVPVFLMALNNCAILSFGAYRVMEGRISMGMLIAFQTLMVSFLSPLNELVLFGGQTQEAKGELDKLDDVLNYQIDDSFSDRTEHEITDQPKLQGYLDLKNVSFGYSRLGAPLIENFDLSLSPGRRLALVGSSGSGKTTVAKLVAGLFKPWGGEILFDGKPRSEYSSILINNSIAIVDQDIFMFKGTVLDNMTMWDHTVPERSVIKAGKDAAIHDDISSRQSGYECEMDEGGNNFSGGQRQRMEIARALVNNPTILVLDEATSSLDPTTERIIDDNIRRRGCACLIIAHRLSTVRDADEIIVMDHGKIVERGNHEELMALDGRYAELIKMV